MGTELVPRGGVKIQVVPNPVVARLAVWLSLCGADHSAPRFIVRIEYRRFLARIFSPQCEQISGQVIWPTNAKIKATVLQRSLC